MKMTKLAVLTALLASTVLAQTSHHQQNAADWKFRRFRRFAKLW